MSEPAQWTGGPRFGDPPEVSKNWIWKAGVGWEWIEPKDEETLAAELPKLEKLKTKLGHAHKPTEAIIQDATNANFAVAARLERDGEMHHCNRQGWTGNGVLSDSNLERYRDRLVEYQRSIERAERTVALMLMWMKRMELNNDLD